MVVGVLLKQLTIVIPMVLRKTILNLVHEYHMGTPSITLPTRLSDNSTLIDNIIYNKQRHLIFAGILENQISDHQAIAINTRPPPCKSKYITLYNNSDASKEKIRTFIN